jgi:hypothetical protein
MRLAGQGDQPEQPDGEEAARHREEDRAARQQRVVGDRRGHEDHRAHAAGDAGRDGEAVLAGKRERDEAHGAHEEQREPVEVRDEQPGDDDEADREERDAQDRPLRDDALDPALAAAGRGRGDGCGGHDGQAP